MAELDNLNTLISNGNSKLIEIDTTLADIRNYGVVEFVNGSSTFDGAGLLTIPVRLALSNGSLSSAVSVGVSVSASAGVNYTLNTPTVTFPSSSVDDATMDVVITITSASTNDTLTVSLINPSGTTVIGTLDEHGVTIDDNIWCQKFDFTIDQQGWTPMSGASSNYGVYVSGTGWKNSGGIYQEVISIRSPLITSTYISTIDVYTTQVIQSSGGGVWKPSTASSYTRTAEGVGQTSFTLGINSNQTQLDVGLDNAHTGSGGVAYTGYITKMIIRGEGQNPFGTTNCA